MDYKIEVIVTVDDRKAAVLIDRQEFPWQTSFRGRPFELIPIEFPTQRLFFVWAIGTLVTVIFSSLVGVAFVVWYGMTGMLSRRIKTIQQTVVGETGRMSGAITSPPPRAASLF